MERLPFPTEVLDHVGVGRLMEDIRVCPRPLFHYRNCHCNAVPFTSQRTDQISTYSTASAAVLRAFIFDTPKIDRRNGMRRTRRQFGSHVWSETAGSEPKVRNGRFRTKTSHASLLLFAVFGFWVCNSKISEIWACLLLSSWLRQVWSWGPCEVQSQ